MRWVRSQNQEMFKKCQIFIPKMDKIKNEYMTPNEEEPGFKYDSSFSLVRLFKYMKCIHTRIQLKNIYVHVLYVDFSQAFTNPGASIMYWFMYSYIRFDGVEGLGLKTRIPLF
jgi:hypothetical protein